MKQKVFITGVGAHAATGSTVSDIWQALLQGRTGVRPITQSNLSAWPCRLGAEIACDNLARLLPDKKWIKVVSRQDVFGIHAAVQAVENSGLLAYRTALSDPSAYNESTGVFVASPGNKYMQQYDFLPLIARSGDNMQQFADALFDTVHPTWLLRILPNNVLAYTGIAYGFKGPNQNIANHAASGMQAIIEAFHAIRENQIDRAVVVAYDVGTEPQALYYYDKLGLISYSDLRPFDAGHDGTIFGEGAAALVLESERSVAERNAPVYAEILGGKSRPENGSLFGIEAEGHSLAGLLEEVLPSGLRDEVACVVAHGNGNPRSDDSEALALMKVFSNNVPAVTAFKWSLGHTLCAAGVLETVLATQMMSEQCIPGIHNWTTPASAAKDLSLCAEVRSMLPGKNIVLINRGFASMNAVLVLRACD
ncbi:MAG: beta-ketoacyl synthase N-terminal-like domain-containing protein [Legionellaceae bacterium]|nr:beta-ketoacyl synthase N-terminal-like domain-containing protein [Legionellaceae bacterium]